MSHIFISYSTKNRTYAEKLASKLRDEGFDVWIDNDRLRSSQDWWREIVLAIWSCSAFIVIMTPEADASEWVQREITIAINEKKPIFPFLLAGDLKTPNWQLFVRTQYEDVRDEKLPPPEFYTRLAKYIQPGTTRGTEVSNVSVSTTLHDTELVQEINNPPQPEIPPPDINKGENSQNRKYLISGLIAFVILITFVVVVSLLSQGVPPPTLTHTLTAPPTATESPTATFTPSQTATETPTLTLTASDIPTQNPTPTPIEIEGNPPTPGIIPIQSVCLITDVGRVNDGTFNQYAYEGMERAREELGLANTFIETQAQTDYAANINTCVEEGYDAIIAVGFLIADATLAAAQANPNILFIGVDQSVTDGPSNYVGMQFREDQAGFLVGAMAALMTQSGTIAGVYGIDIPPVVKFRNGYEQGARYINPDINVLGVYIDSFTAPDRGAAAAEQFIGEGADVIFGAGGPTGSGAIAFAATAGAWVIGVDQDEYFTTFGGGETPGADHLISSALKRVDNGVYQLLEIAAGSDESQWRGGTSYILEITNGGIGFAPSHNANVPQEVTDQVNEILDGLLNGSIQTGVDPVTGALLEPVVP